MAQVVRLGGASARPITSDGRPAAAPASIFAVNKQRWITAALAIAIVLAISVVLAFAAPKSSGEALEDPAVEAATVAVLDEPAAKDAERAKDPGEVLDDTAAPTR